MNETFEQLSDTEIIQKIIAGEFALYEILIRRNNAALYKTGRAYNYNHEDTQDLMQDTFINAYFNLRQFDNCASFKTWLIKIMLNNCFKKQHKLSYKNEISAHISDKASPVFLNRQYADTNRIIVNKELSTVIEEAIEHLPLDYRLVFSLREINGLNVSETADILNISTSNVKVRLNRAKSILKKEIEKFYSPDEIFEFNLIYCDAMVNAVMSEIKKSRTSSE